MAKYTSKLAMLILAVQIQLFRGEATTFTIVNNCDYTVWPVIDTPGFNTKMNFTDAFPMLSGDSKTININSTWTGRLWGRTLCSTDSITGNFSCLTGDCGTGKIDCQGNSYTSPVTLVEMSTKQVDGQDFYDVSLVNGYNLPLSMAPVKGDNANRCAVTGCVFDYNEGCPDELRVINDEQSIIGCRSPCDVFHTNESCCTNVGDCQRNNFSLGSLIFKKACPRAYSYSLDDATATFFCPNPQTSYTINFCPPASLASVVSKPLQSVPPSMPAASPLPSPTSLIPTSPPTNLPKNVAVPPSKNRSKTERTILLVGLPISAAAISILLLYGLWNSIRKRKHIRTSTSLEVTEIKRAVLDSLEFNLDKIRVATNNFAIENKLGEGGFGAVYKGKLENGQEIAVKRLSKNSGQGDVEFKTEVVLVAKLRHKNLVKLLGFCVALEEKILVYEFLPKSSLDRYLFDPTKQSSLDWQTRFKIIAGIAKGLLYLHEDSPLMVIHRDLKSSNILLDEGMNPKISDFGLARLVGADQTQGDTKRIVGTHGYMAPEYAMTGHYSVKSDVYSFGVLVLEIVSGQRSRFAERVQLEEALLHRAWRLWNEEKTLDLVDTTLKNFPEEEITKCIHIGLSCIQEDAVARPRMTSIVAALNGQAVNSPLNPPKFFGTKIFEDNEIQKNSVGVYTGTNWITDLYPRD